MTDPANAANAATTTDAAAAAGKTFTQDEVDRLIGDRLARERGKYADYDEAKTKAAEYDKLADSQKSDLERLTGERDTLKSESQKHAEENARLRVALEKGLVGDRASLVDRLRGSTAEELAADADVLLAQIGPPAATAFDGGARSGTQPQSMDDVIRKAAGY